MLRVSFQKSTRLLGALVLLALPLTLASAASATTPATDEQDLSADFMDHGDHHSHRDFSPLIKKVHDATAKYQDFNFPLHKEKGWAIAPPCVSRPDAGAMGIHVVMGSRHPDGILA